MASERRCFTVSGEVMEIEEQIAAFVKARDEALLALDEKRIRKLYRMNGGYVPEAPQAFWGAVHKARLEIEAMPEDAKEISRKWLREHGMKTFMGDEP